MSNTDNIPAMLSTAQRAWERGNTSSALAVLHMLSAQYPNDVRVRLMLENYERALHAPDASTHKTAILPELHSSAPAAATSSEARITTALPEFQAVAEPAVAPEPPLAFDTALAATSAEHTWPAVTNVYDQATRPATAIRWPMYVIIAAASVIIGITAIWRWTNISSPVSQPIIAALTPSLVPINTLIPTLPPGVEPGNLPVIVPPELPTLTLAPATITFTALPSATPSPIPTPQATITPRPVLTQGQIVQSGTWSVSLLRPEHAMTLDGAIGSLQPQGRFVLVLLSVGYTGEGAARVPANLVMLEDDQGRLYAPELAASSAYLDTFGRGQYGDISLEEEIPPDAGNLSIPFIFDVPETAHQLHIVVTGQPAVWLLP